MQDFNPTWGVLLDTKGPEIRTAMLVDGKNILLEKGQEIIIEAVGDMYTQFEGYKTPKETRIGLSYGKLCSSVTPGDRILIADGTITVTVQKLLSPTELLGEVENTKELGQRKNCNLPGIHSSLATVSLLCHVPVVQSLDGGSSLQESELIYQYSLTRTFMT
jgi:pyruvate kinase